MANDSKEDLAKEMRDVKMLLVLQLLLQGAKQGDIARMLNVSDATVSRLIPKEVKASLKGGKNG